MDFVKQNKTNHLILTKDLYFYFCKYVDFFQKCYWEWSEMSVYTGGNLKYLVAKLSELKVTLGSIKI